MVEGYERAYVPGNRADFALALGMLCEVAEPPWHARLTEGFHDLALVPALAEVLDIL